jgi:hypothetical protein
MCSFVIYKYVYHLKFHIHQEILTTKHGDTSHTHLFYLWYELLASYPITVYSHKYMRKIAYCIHWDL